MPDVDAMRRGTTVSLTIREVTAETFLDQFEHVRAALRRSQILLGLGQTALVAGAGLLVLIAADFRLELSWIARACGLAALAVAALGVLFARVVAPMRWWSRPRTAAEIERWFPQLGQRVRTVVQYGILTDDAIDDAGVTVSLVEALGDETEEQVRPLPLDRVVPRAKVWMGALLAAAPIALILTAAFSAGEWRTAIRRALLGNGAYTTLVLSPADTRIEQGGSVAFAVELSGRPRRNVVLHTRPLDRPEGPWTTTPMHLQDGARTPGISVPRVATLEKVREPLAFRAVAGPVASPTYTIDVRYPLAIQSFEVGLTPPAYTRVAPSTVKGGDVQAIEGTVATFRVTFDAPPAQAVLIFTDPSIRPKKGAPEPKPLVLPLTAEGKAYVAALTLVKGGHYRIDARTADGRLVPKNGYRIDVHEDRAPRVGFDEPDEALEVHPVAEVRNRVRVGDDFGLSKAGIVFRLNDGEEQTLLLKEFANGPDDKPTTAATIEEMLLVEKLKATPTDSILYYAFAEDNHPSGAKRTETDLRYLDIRPFKREYKSPDGEPGDDNGGQSTALSELIARQRFNLSRASRHAHRRPNDRSPTEDPLKIATFEEMLVGLVRDFTEGIEGIVGERVEPLHQAEEAMLASIEALDRGRTNDPPNRMAEALRHLIEVRRTFQVLVAGGGKAARAARAFDRTQTQKIRKPKGKNEEAEAVADELEQLAREEDFVYATLSGLKMDGDPAQPAPSGEQSGDSQKAEAKSQAAPPSNRSKVRREAMERQEKIADDARTLNERLKRLDEVSDLAKERMTKAAEAAEKAAGALARGSTKEGTDATRAGALMLHEVARQVKGETSREVADELAMARDLADELARREDEFANGGDPGVKGEKGEKGATPGNGLGGDWKDLTDADMLERLEEAARTLQEWLKGASKNAEGDAAERVRDVLRQTPPAEVVERAERVGTLFLGGQKKEARAEARTLARALEGLSRQLDMLHRGIVAPELAKLVEFNRRAAELTARSRELKSDAQVAEWRRQAAALVRELEKAGLTDAAATLDRLLRGGGLAHWKEGPDGFLTAPDGYADALSAVVARLQERVQNLILKDLATARDEAAPPEFRELVERYYEVLSTSRPEVR